MLRLWTHGSSSSHPIHERPAGHAVKRTQFLEDAYRVFSGKSKTTGSEAAVRRALLAYANESSLPNSVNLKKPLHAARALLSTTLIFTIRQSEFLYVRIADVGAMRRPDYRCGKYSNANTTYLGEASMSDYDKTRVPLAIVSGIFCLLVGLAQFLYAFLAFASVIFVDLLGLVLTMATSAIAIIPEKPYEITYARELATTIGMTGMGFSIATIACACRSFFRRHVSRIDLTICAVFGTCLAVFHFMNSLSFGGVVYVFVVVQLFAMLLIDQVISRATTVDEKQNRELSVGCGPRPT